jgi:hypothetical protein
MKLIFSILFLFSKVVYGQIWQPINNKEKTLLNYDINYLGIINFLQEKKFDTSLLITYKGAYYFLGKKNDSLVIIQNVIVEKVINLSKKKVIKRFKRSRKVFDGLIDSCIIDRKNFSSLVNLNQHKALNNPNVKASDLIEKPMWGNFYIQTFERGVELERFKIDRLWLRNLQLNINDWHLTRLILQMFFDFNHWGVIEEIINANKKGNYVINNNFFYGNSFYFDGRLTFIENDFKQVFKNHFPIYFAAPNKSKPQNKYLMLPNLSKDYFYILE